MLSEDARCELAAAVGLTFVTSVSCKERDRGRVAVSRLEQVRDEECLARVVYYQKI
jgi:hypothetical protein